MDGGHSFPFSQESILRVERCSTMLGADVMALQQSRSEIQNPLPLRTARGFSLCPHFLLDEQPQCFFDKRRTTRHASAFLDPVECFDQITRNVGIQCHTTGLSLPRPVGGNASPNLCCAFFHVYK